MKRQISALRRPLCGLVCGLGVGLSSILAAGDAAGGGPAAGGVPPAPVAPSKVAVIFRLKVLATSARKKEIEAEIEKRSAAIKEKEQNLAVISNGMQESLKNMKLGTGDMRQMQEQVITLVRQQLQLEEELKEMRYRQRKEGAQMVAALMLDLQKAIEKVALRENLDIVLNREDAEMAALEKEKAKSGQPDKTSAAEKADPANREKLEKEMAREMTDQMLAKLQNTFVWSNDAMDVTNAVMAELDRAYRARETTRWEDMKLPDELNNANDGGNEGGAPGGAVAPE